MIKSRREFLAVAALAPVAITVAASARAAETVCYDPAQLSLSDRNNRSSVNFLEKSPDAARRCGICAFFEHGGLGCGSCKLFAGMPVNANGVCDSFAAKPG